VEKYKIEGALELIFMFSQSVGNILKAPTLYIIQDFGIQHINALLSGFIKPTNGTSEIYHKASKILNSDILYESNIVNVNRTKYGIDIIVQMHNDKFKLIKTKQLLITIPPLLDNLKNFDLDENEINLFRKWKYTFYYVAILNNTGIPDKRNVINIDPNNKIGNIPSIPFQWHLDYMGVSGYLATKVVGDMNFTERDAKNLIISDFNRMNMTGTYHIKNPNFIAVKDHTPSTMNVPVDEIKNGFYRKLYKLQGHKNTFYTGLSFCSDYSSLLWAYTDKVIEKMINYN
ncbi:hypothetical protein K492DRAFT_139134, partial [Lichtheimia hyalospora FSU 10163]